MIYNGKQTSIKLLLELKELKYLYDQVITIITSNRAYLHIHAQCCIAWISGDLRGQHARRIIVGKTSKIQNNLVK